MAKQNSKIFVFAAKGLAQIEDDAKAPLAIDMINQFLTEDMLMGKRKATGTFRQMKTYGLLKPGKLDDTYTVNKEKLQQLSGDEGDEEEQEQDN